MLASCSSYHCHVTSDPPLSGIKWQPFSCAHRFCGSERAQWDDLFCSMVSGAQLGRLKGWKCVSLWSCMIACYISANWWQLLSGTTAGSAGWKPIHGPSTFCLVLLTAWWLDFKKEHPRENQEETILSYMMSLEVTWHYSQALPDSVRGNTKPTSWWEKYPNIAVAIFRKYNEPY